MRALRRPLLRHAVIYGAGLAGAALLLELANYRSLAHHWSSEIYVTLVAVAFTTLGAWLGVRLAPLPRSAIFTRNDAAIASLRISRRELAVLDELAGGASNKVIARRLAISPNTVKSHMTQLFEKLDAGNRTEAVARARDLSILP